MADCSPRTMGLDFGLDDPDFSPKMKFRWLFKIPDICADSDSVKCLAPKRSARPSLGWKEEVAQHITESITYPWKPEWKPIQLVMYDSRCDGNPVFDWLRYAEDGSSPGFYDPQSAKMTPIVAGQLKRDATLTMLDGCGNTIETWTLENCYPSNIEWGDLDMESHDIVMVDVTIKFDRAFIIKGSIG